MILQLRVINLRLTFFFCQSVSVRAQFGQSNFLFFQQKRTGNITYRYHIYII